VNKKKAFSSENLSTFKNDALDKAKNIISEDIDKLEKAGFKVKHFPVDIDNHILICERTPLSYDGTIPTLIEVFLRNKSKKNAVRLEKNNKICAIELHIKSETANGKKCNKIIRYFVFKYTQSQDKYVIKDCNNAVYNTYVSSLIKKANKHGKEYAFKDQIDAFLLRCCFPNRFGEQAYTFRDKDCSVFAFIGFFLLLLIILLFIWLL